MSLVDRSASESAADSDVADEAVDSARSSVRSRVQSVDRAVVLLEELLRASSPMTAVDIANRVGLNRTVVHRLLRTLRDVHMVSESESGRFMLGPAMLRYGTGYLERLPVRQQSLPLLAELARDIADRPWVVALAVPIGLDMILAERSWSPHLPLGTMLGTGMSIPITNSAHGLAVLSCMTDEEAVQLLGDQYTEDLRRRVEEVRQADNVGVLMNHRRHGVGAIAAAIRGKSGRAAGSIAISGVEFTDAIDAQSEIGHRLRSVADTISLSLELRAD